MPASESVFEVDCLKKAMETGEIVAGSSVSACTVEKPASANRIDIRSLPVLKCLGCSIGNPLNAISVVADSQPKRLIANEIYVNNLVGSACNAQTEST